MAAAASVMDQQDLEIRQGREQIRRLVTRISAQDLEIGELRRLLGHKPTL